MKVLSRIRLMLTQNLGLKVLALVLAVLSFLYSHGEENEEATFRVPVEYLFPADLVLMNDDPLPEQVVIVASGTRTALSRTQDLDLRYVVDLEEANSGTTEYSFRQPPSSFPERLRISTVSPAMIRFSFDEQDRRLVPVQIRVRGSLPAGFVETERSVVPAEVALAGAKSELAELTSIQTTPLRLDRYAQGFDGDLALDTTGLHLLPESASSVSVKLVVEEVMAEREYGAVRVSLSRGLSARLGLLLEPTAALVTLKGPVPVLDLLRTENLTLELGGPVGKLPAVGEESSVGWAPGARAEGELGLTLRIDHPRGERIEVVAVSPSAIVLRSELVETPDSAIPEEGATPDEPEEEP
ncbi:MAG: hypothetical protein KDA24_02080 [Deltaproteobacteria bacterium]|nr:hypothetical protein [Deltaproteobacteria bacterium]